MLRSGSAPRMCTCAQRQSCATRTGELGGAHLPGALEAHDLVAVIVNLDVRLALFVVRAQPIPTRLEGYEQERTDAERERTPLDGSVFPCACEPTCNAQCSPCRTDHYKRYDLRKRDSRGCLGGVSVAFHRAELLENGRRKRRARGTMPGASGRR